MINFLRGAIRFVAVFTLTTVVADSATKVVDKVLGYDKDNE
jgi:hypothetical protein